MYFLNDEVILQLKLGIYNWRGCHTVTLFNTLSGRSRGKLAGKVSFTLTFSLAILFSTLPAIHSSSVAALISYGEVVRRSRDVTGWEEHVALHLPSSHLDVNWMAASVSPLPTKRFTSVTGLHSFAAGTCPLPLNVSLYHEWQCDTSMRRTFGIMTTDTFLQRNSVSQQGPWFQFILAILYNINCISIDTNNPKLHPVITLITIYKRIYERI